MTEEEMDSEARRQTNMQDECIDRPSFYAGFLAGAGFCNITLHIAIEGLQKISGAPGEDDSLSAEYAREILIKLDAYGFDKSGL